MDAPSTTPTESNADTVDASPDQGPNDPLRASDVLRTPAIARRRMAKTGAFSSPVRRSPRLSGLPPPQPPVEFQETGNLDESSGSGSESIDDIDLQLSREDTPENDPLLPDEPSSVLASRIMRAHDNPSPPPQDLACPSIDNAPERDFRFLTFGASPPPSPFRPINLLERLGQPSPMAFDPSRSLQSLTLSDSTEPSESVVVPAGGHISPTSRRTSITSVSIHAAPVSSTQFPTNSLPSWHVHVHELADPSDGVGVDPFTSITGLYGPPMSTTTSPCAEALYASSAQVSNFSSPAAHSPQDAETIIPAAGSETGKIMCSIQNNILLIEAQESKLREIANDVNGDQHLRLDSLPLHPTPYLHPEPVPSVEKATLPAESACIDHTPPSTPRPSTMRPDLSGSAIQRPVIPSTPARVNGGALKSNSPLKFFSEVRDIHRTPAQRVPIETVFTRGTPSFQRTLPTGQDQAQLGRFITTRTPIFKRPALNDPSRTPAKRIPVTGLIGSPSKGNQSQVSPTRLDLRARSASVEPRSIAPISARSRSVEPLAVTSKVDDEGITKESIAPIATMPPRPGLGLPFPLVGSDKSTNDLPSPITEESEDAKDRAADINVAPSTLLQSKRTSQLRQSSASSRIPRIGSKPYARPLSKGPKAASHATTVNTSRAPRTSLFQASCKSSGIGKSNPEASSTESTNEPRLSGPLKRKRGAEMNAPSNSQPIMIRQVVPGILSEKYAPKPIKIPSQPQTPLEPSPPKVPQPLKFRKVVDGMLSARYASAATNLSRPESSASSVPLSPLSDLSSSSNEDLVDANVPAKPDPLRHPENETLDTPSVDVEPPIMGPNMQQSTPLHQDDDNIEPSSRPRRGSRSRKPAQQQYVIDVFNRNTSTRAPTPRRKPQPRTEGEGFLGMSATALKALTTSNTTKNQQIIAVLVTEVIRKEGLRPESPAVKVRTILQKQQDERDRRRKDRAQRRAHMSEEGASDTEGQPALGEGSLAPRSSRGVRDEGNTLPLNQCRGPGDEDYMTPEKLERTVEPLKLDGLSAPIRPGKQVKWHPGLSTAIYLNEVDLKPKPLSNNVIVMRGCLAPASKNLPLDPLGNLVDVNNRPFPELVAEHITVKKYLYDDDVEPEPVATKITRSRSKRSKS